MRNQRQLRLSPEALQGLLADLADLLDSGFTLHDALSALAEDSEQRAVAAAAGVLAVETAQGRTLVDSVAGIWPEQVVSGLRAGEAGGQLVEVLTEAAAQLEAQQRLRQQLRELLRYPLAVMALVSLALTALIRGLLPELRRFFVDLGIGLPPQTRALLWTLDHLFWLLSALAGVLTLVWLLRWWHGRRAQRCGRPGVRALVSWAAFCRHAALLYRAGMPAAQALPMAARALPDPVLARLLPAALADLSRGHSLSEVLSPALAVPRKLRRYLLLGERQGRLERAMLRGADYAETLAMTRLQRRVALVAPMATLLAAGVLAWTIWAFILPLYAILGSGQL